MRAIPRILCCFALGSLAVGCGSSGLEDEIAVGVIGDDRKLDEHTAYLSSAEQHLRMAVAAGLVGFDSTGQVVPAVAQRWIVTEDGLSYIFRISDTEWTNGEAVTAPQVRRVLLETIGRYKNSALGFDLAKIKDVRAMTGRVIEIQLFSPMPDLLSLLAQPELGLQFEGHSIGPMQIIRRESKSAVVLGLLAPESDTQQRESGGRAVLLAALPARQAVEAFSTGQLDLVLNGTIADFPLANSGPLSRGNVRLDATRGLLGFLVRSPKSLMARADLREAISMAIDRDTLIQGFNIDGWKSQSWPVPRELLGSLAPTQDQWANLSLEQRRAAAARRIAAWKVSTGEDAKLAIYLPLGPGSDRLFARIRADLNRIGVHVIRAGEIGSADMQLIDRIERFESPRWYLDQFHCSLNRGLCSSEADALVARSIMEPDERAELADLARANEAIAAAHVYIPLGVPVRWSLVRSDVNAFRENSRGLHPLYFLATQPN